MTSYLISMYSILTAGPFCVYFLVTTSAFAELQSSEFVRY